MNIKKELIPLERGFPFQVTNTPMPPHYCMENTFHWHECLEISYVKKGKGRYYVEDRIYEMEPGDIIVINNVEPHYLEVYEEGMLQPVFIFEPSLVWSECGNCLDYDYLKPFFERGTDFCNKLDKIHPLTREIRMNLEAIETEYMQQPEGYRLMIKSRLLLILTYLIRYFREGKRHGESLGTRRQNLARLEDILQYMSTHFQQDVRLEEAASMLCVSPPYFSSFFRKATGTTFVDYLNKLRVNHAIRFLKETDAKITQVAMECGFNSTASFNSTFKRYTGKTPSDVRRERP